MPVGIDGVKVRVFGASMDTKGREELLGMYHDKLISCCHTHDVN